MEYEKIKQLMEDFGNSKLSKIAVKQQKALEKIQNQLPEAMTYWVRN